MAEHICDPKQLSSSSSTIGSGLLSAGGSHGSPPVGHAPCPQVGNAPCRQLGHAPCHA